MSVGIEHRVGGKIIDAEPQLTALHERQLHKRIKTLADELAKRIGGAFGCGHLTGGLCRNCHCCGQTQTRERED